MSNVLVPVSAEEWATHQKSFADILNAPRPSWLIKDVLPQGSIVYVVGLEATGKSFVVQSWAAAIASGSDWFGHETQPGVVYYLALEGNPRYIVERFQAWEKLHDSEIDSTRRLPIVTAFDYSNKDQMANLLEGVRSGVSMVVVDTLAVFAKDANINNAHEVDFIKQFVKEILEASNHMATIVFVAHSTKNDNSGAAGSIQINAMSDKTWHMTKTASNYRMKSHKDKNNANGSGYVFEIENVSIASGITAGVLTISGNDFKQLPAVTDFVNELFADYPPNEPVPQSALVAQALGLGLKPSRSTVIDWLTKAERHGLLVSAGSRTSRTFSTTDDDNGISITDYETPNNDGGLPLSKEGNPVIADTDIIEHDLEGLF